MKVIISATHMLAAGRISTTPAEFLALKRFDRSDFLVNDDDAISFLRLPEPVGVDPKVWGMDILRYHSTMCWSCRCIANFNKSNEHYRVHRSSTHVKYRAAVLLVIC
jgi:hypothetical protein